MARTSSASPSDTNQRYRVDLRSFIGVCEGNYLRFMRLMPDMESNDERVFGVLQPSDHLSQVKIVVTERCKYTTTVDISQESSLSDWLPVPKLSVRLYHDAKMAEVLSFQQNRYIQPKYTYPNENMYQRDEKAQLNVFLREWLGHCIQEGCAVKVPQF